MELLDFEAKEPKEDAQAVRPALFARKDDALAAKGARAEGEEDGLAVALVLAPDAHKLLQQRGRHAHAIQRALRLVRPDRPVGRDPHRPPQRRRGGLALLHLSLTVPPLRPPLRPNLATLQPRRLQLLP